VGGFTYLLAELWITRAPLLLEPEDKYKNTKECKFILPLLINYQKGKMEYI
jgi:hypothetical protein